MNKKISLGAAIAYMAIVAAVVFSITWISSWNNFNLKLTDLSERQKMYGKLAEVDEYVRGSYYDTIDEDALMTGIVEGYISGLGDERAKYLTAEEYGSYTKSESDQYVGIGVVTEIDESGYIRVKDTYPDSPAQTAGIVAGDLIISVDGTVCKASNYEELVNSFKGEAGAKVTLVVRTANDDRTIELTRRSIDIPTVKYTLADGGIAYFSFTEITGNTAQQFENKLDEAMAAGAKAAIMDIRGLSSENVRHVGDMLSVLLSDGPLIYSKDGSGDLTLLATSDSRGVELPMVVIADATTKGTVELFALAMKDYARATIVGEATAGQGSYQEVKKLSDGSAIVITTARYTGPNGIAYDGVGVLPDYEVALVGAEDQRDQIIGVAESDAPYKKALEIAASEIAAAATSSQS